MRVNSGLRRNATGNAEFCLPCSDLNASPQVLIRRLPWCHAGIFCGAWTPITPPVPPRYV